MKKLSLIVAALGFLASAAHAESATYALDPSHSFASWEIPHFGTSMNRGRFNKTTGTVTIDKAAKTGSLDVTVDTTSLDTGTAQFTKHISSEEMLNVAAFPTSHLVANKFTFSADGKVTQIDGSLTLLDKTNPVTLKATNYNCYMSPMVKKEVCGGDFEMTIVRSQYGVSYGLNYGFSDSMKVVIQVEGVKQ